MSQTNIRRAGFILLLAAGFLLLTFFTRDDGVISGHFRAVTNEYFQAHQAFVIPPAMTSKPSNLKLFPWVYEVQLEYRFPTSDGESGSGKVASRGIPPNQETVLTAGVFECAMPIHFTKAEATFTRYFRGWKLKPLAQRWRIDFPAEIPATAPNSAR
jgi:hypothetical protein